jgi:hypothetical protein
VKAFAFTALLLPALAVQAALPTPAWGQDGAGAAAPPHATMAPVGAQAPAVGKKKPAGQTASHRPATEGPGAVVPGFELLGDGSSRLFVQIPKAVAYETKAGRGTITYVLKDVHVEKRNNYNPLVTVHFNTPVSKARLVPHGHDLWFVVSLRAKAQPQVSMEPAKEGGAVLHVDFPKGDYLPAGAPQADTQASDETPPPASPNAPGH